MTTRLDGRWVVASTHAIARARLRIPEAARMSDGQAQLWLETLVGRALRDGRKATRCPRWCVRSNETGLRRRARARQEGFTRFVWDEDETVVCLVRRHPHEWLVGCHTWVVLTVLAPEDESAVA